MDVINISLLSDLCLILPPLREQREIADYVSRETTSIDALMVGVSFGLVKLSIWMPALLIGIVALLLSAVGFRLGRTASRYMGRWAECVGGIVLMAIGTRILVQHLSGMA